jgi:hypothetical protein
LAAIFVIAIRGVGYLACAGCHIRARRPVGRIAALPDSGGKGK